MLFASCDQDDEDNEPTSRSNQSRIQVANANVFIGEWKIKRFLDGSEDETPSFRDITLDFKPEGTINVQRSNQLIATGNWFLIENGQELWIQIPDFANENEAFGEDIYEINDDWYISKANGMELHLFEEEEVIHLAR